MSARLFAAVLVASALVHLSLGCLVEPIDLDDRKCDEEHPCIDGYTCVDEVCERDDEDSGSAQ